MNTNTAWASLVFGLLWSFLVRVEGGVINARSVSREDVAAAVAQAANGDTVLVPAGTATWTKVLTIDKSITLQGATTVDISAETASDRTIILDDTPISGPESGILVFNKACRLSGFTFKKGSYDEIATGTGAIRLHSGRTVRIDHCHFDGLYQSDPIFAKNVFGVIDHNIFHCISSSSTALVWHDAWGGGTNAYGDGSWAEPSYWGSDKFLFFEDNVIFGVSKQTSGGIDTKRGARLVVRHNKIHDSCGPLSNHGTEHGPQRGLRALECYNNTFQRTKQYTPGQLRGGCMLLHNNTWTGTRPGSPNVGLTSFRSLAVNEVFGGTSGKNPWDLNDTTGGPNGDGLYASGTHTGTRSNTLVDSNANWTPNQWMGKYVVTNLNQSARGFTYNCSYPLSHTANTMTFSVGLKSERGPDLLWDPGDRYEIRKVIAALDQCGRGGGELVRATDRPRWPNQVLDPIYSWNNKKMPENTSINVGSGYPSILVNRDYYNNTVKPNYTPYVYPHPLVSGAPPPAAQAPAAPSNLRVVNEP